MGSANFHIDQELPRHVRENLEIGSQLTGRVVHCFGNQRYLFRIMGRNLVLFSEMPLEMRREQTFVVKSIDPQIHLVPQLIETETQRDHKICILV